MQIVIALQLYNIDIMKLILIYICSYMYTDMYTGMHVAT